MSPPLFTMHGFTGRPDAWDEAVPGPHVGLALIGHAPELPVPPGWTFAREVDRVLDRLPREPVHLAGYSMGGRVALAAAVRAPRRIARLTIVSAHPGLDDGSERRADDERWCEILERRGIAAFVDAWEAQPMWRSQDALPAALRERQRRARLDHSAAELAAALRALGVGAMPSFWPHLAALPMPVDWVAGALDPKYFELAGRAAARIPHGRVLIVPEAGHNVLLERPEPLSRALVGARGERRAI
jgi:2-succinyl-6-hydroxy-2,4-cyclohexadiene-1-carboxylate synthase